MNDMIVTSVSPIIALAYLTTKLVLMKLFKLAPRHPAGLVPLLFDLIFIVPYLFLSILDLKVGGLKVIFFAQDAKFFIV